MGFGLPLCKEQNSYWTDHVRFAVSGRFELLMRSGANASRSWGGHVSGCTVGLASTARIGVYMFRSTLCNEEPRYGRCMYRRGKAAVRQSSQSSLKSKMFGRSRGPAAGEHSIHLEHNSSRICLSPFLSSRSSYARSRKDES